MTKLCSRRWLKLSHSLVKGDTNVENTFGGRSNKF